eukprot:CAMPEP_0204206598 /NCGR_PEP_ID=MMETSP0361-20130328/71163_1 /ASSEMBLY_ACC=CAM_ASM_000343 /TAXON_ID=268821 /ORGANISM="Scrippsiella Hangoei, Strain SHTV-5" /LENGTH=220 /DNA_ID=CAMNT_0051170043 /DNA_START=92 /DNA_END=751 /DNA_ORIENTATION=+
MRSPVCPGNLDLSQALSLAFSEDSTLRSDVLRSGKRYSLDYSSVSAALTEVSHLSAFSMSSRTVRSGAGSRCPSAVGARAAGGPPAWATGPLPGGVGGGSGPGGGGSGPGTGPGSASGSLLQLQQVRRSRSVSKDAPRSGSKDVPRSRSNSKDPFLEEFLLRQNILETSDDEDDDIACTLAGSVLRDFSSAATPSTASAAQGVNPLPASPAPTPRSGHSA